MATIFGHTKDDRLDLTHWQSPLELSTAISESQKELDANKSISIMVFTYCIHLRTLKTPIFKQIFSYLLEITYSSLF